MRLFGTAPALVPGIGTATVLVSLTPVAADRRLGGASSAMSDTGMREPATFQEIREILRQVSESQKETDRRMQETRLQMQQETDRRMQETERLIREVAEGQKETRLQMQETDRRMQETDRQLRETGRQLRQTDVRLKKLDDLFNGQWGKLMEALVSGDLIKLLRARDVEVDHVTSRLQSGNGAPQWEIDLIAANGDEVVAVEVKTTLKVGDVVHFVDTLKRFAVQAPAVYRGKRLYGGVAYLRADGSSDVYAERQGLFVIRATGSSASITNGEQFTPRTFG